MFERDLETNLVQIFDALVTDFPVYGMTVPSESRDSSCVLIKLSPHSRKSINNPTCTCDGEIQITIAKTDDRDTDSISDVVEIVGDQLSAWSDDLDATCDTLTVDTFRTDGYQYMGGEPIGFDNGNQVWFCNLKFQISGVKINAVQP